MFRSPPQLRSGNKVQPVPLSKNEPKLVRSLSDSSSSSACIDSTMPADKPVKVIDPALIAACVDKHLSSGDVINQLVSRLTLDLKIVVEEAVRAALTAVNKEVAVLRGEVECLTAAVSMLNERLTDRSDELEQYQRRNNVRIFGIEEAAGEDTDEIVVDLCRDKLGVSLPVEAICRSHRVGKPPAPGPDGQKRHRPIIVRFTSYRDRRQVYGAKKKLKGSGVTIREDLTTRRLDVLRKATAVHGVRNTWTQDGRVLWVDKAGGRGMATRPEDIK